jgi:O-antigen/teichoic acid export membrane protein
MDPSGQRPVANDDAGATKRGGFHWPTFAADALLVWGGGLLANFLNYLYHFVLSRSLGPDAYGSLATLLAITMIVGVLGSSVGTLAMQETARLWVTHRDGAIATFGRGVLRSAALLGASVGIVMVVAALPLSAYLHVTDRVAWAFLIVALVAGLVAGAARGAIQGAHRFTGYAASLVGECAVKLALGIVLVRAGLAVGGAMAGVAAGLVVGIAIAVTALFAVPRRSDDGYRSAPYGTPALSLLVINAASMALLYVDTVFAKHSLSGVAAGEYTAAGLVARIIPFGIGLLVPLVMPKAAAARHVDRAALGRLLAVAFGIGAGGILLVLAFVEIWPTSIVHVTFGAQYAQAALILRLYAIDGALLALGMLGSSYLVSVGDYRIGAWMVGSLALQAGAMALYGTSPASLIAIAAIGNALIVPVVAVLVARSLRDTPQAPAPRGAESMVSRPERA